MKKQNENNKLTFNKTAVTELNGNQLDQINGGSKDLLSLIVQTAGYGTWLLVV
jgi:hypothetical protein